MSVVIPFYGVDIVALSACVRNLLDQDYPDNRFAIFIVDNNAVASALPAKLRERCTILHEPRPGSYAARNRGIADSNGSVIAFTDADCVPDRRWISSGVSALQRAIGPVIVGGRIAFSFRQDSSKTTTELLDSIIHHRQTEYVSVDSFAATANLFVTRELISAHGRFDDRFLSAGDREFGQRLAAAGVSVVVAEDAIVVHPARVRVIDLVRKNLRGVGGQKVSLDVQGNATAFQIFRLQITGYRHRQRLISQWARNTSAGLGLQMGLRALLALLYAARILECVRLVLGGLPRRD